MADIEDRADVGMTQTGERLRLAFKASLQIRFVGNLIRKDFYSDETIEASVLGFVDLSHATDANRRKDLVRTEFSAFCYGHKSVILFRITAERRGCQIIRK